MGLKEDGNQYTRTTQRSRRSLIFPPLWQQRRYAVCCAMREWKPRKVLDLGTGEGKLLLFLKNEEYIHELAGVDVDRHSLSAASSVSRTLSLTLLCLFELIFIFVVNLTVHNRTCNRTFVIICTLLIPSKLLSIKVCIFHSSWLRHHRFHYNSRQENYWI